LFSRKIPPSSTLKANWGFNTAQALGQAELTLYMGENFIQDVEPFCNFF
jgi:hypothetical protein